MPTNLIVTSVVTNIPRDQFSPTIYHWPPHTPTELEGKEKK